MAPGNTEKPSHKVQIARALRRYSNPCYIRRHILGTTMRELAEQAGIDKGTISRIETGHTIPQHLTLVRLSLAFGLTPGQLYDEIMEWRSVEITEENAEEHILEAVRALELEDDGAAEGTPRDGRGEARGPRGSTPAVEE